LYYSKTYLRYGRGQSLGDGVVANCEYEPKELPNWDRNGKNGMAVNN
jgi:hypothetical protein